LACWQLNLLLIACNKKVAPFRFSLCKKQNGKKAERKNTNNKLQTYFPMH